MFDRIDDTIVAISSPPGVGSRGIVRLSGARAIELADAVFRCDDATRLSLAGGHERRFGSLRLDAGAFVPAEAYIFRAPASYTRQDLIELHTVGSPPVLSIILDELVAGGARPAEPGEFTGRAFLLGAMDLTRVEGVAAIIHAQTDAQLRASEVLLHGALGRRTRQMREELADLLALVEAGIDFAEEPIEFISPQRVAEVINGTLGSIEDLLAHSGLTERLELLPRVVLAGLPNAGKSTLFNRLTGLDRAIQSATAGTTRDVITAPVRLSGHEILLCDTAGLFLPGRWPDLDPALVEPQQELAGRIHDATIRAIQTADLVLIVVDAADAPLDEVEFVSRWCEVRRSLLVLNKIDRLNHPDQLISQVHAGLDTMLKCISARVAKALRNCAKPLRKRYLAMLMMSARCSCPCPIDNVDRFRMQRTRFNVRASGAEGGASACAELVATELRHAVDALGLLLGEVTSEDILTRIFSRFCIGK